MLTSTLAISDDDFKYFKDKIFDLAGIHLTEKKMDLMQTRLQSLFKKSEVNSIDELKRGLEQGNLKAVQTFINILTTNKTDFFREPQHFEFLIQRLIPRWQRIDQKEVNIWCCASSTGEEPYSLAMVLQAHMPPTIRWTILATDIDTAVLQTAANGVYPLEEKNQIPDVYKEFLVFGKKKFCQLV